MLLFHILVHLVFVEYRSDSGPEYTQEHKCIPALLTFWRISFFLFVTWRHNTKAARHECSSTSQQFFSSGPEKGGEKEEEKNRTAALHISQALERVAGFATVMFTQLCPTYSSQVSRPVHKGWVMSQKTVTTLMTYSIFFYLTDYLSVSEYLLSWRSSVFVMGSLN